MEKKEQICDKNLTVIVHQSPLEVWEWEKYGFLVDVGGQAVNKNAEEVLSSDI